MSTTRIGTRAESRETTRRSILEQAGAILADKGPHALSMRRLAEAVGASTIVLYTHFSNKQEILNELYLEGFSRLRTELAQVPLADDPLDYVTSLGRAYRGSALASPTHYQIMFSPCFKVFSPTPTSLETSKACFDVLRAGVQRCAEAGFGEPTSVDETAEVLWGTLHGLISLELIGYWGSPEAGAARVEDAMQMLRAGLNQQRAPGQQTPVVPRPRP